MFNIPRNFVSYHSGITTHKGSNLRLFLRFFSSAIFSSILLLSLTAVQSVIAQSTGSWTSITSYNTVNSITSSEDNTIWGISNGGLFSVNDTAFDIQLTPVDGMYRLDGSKIIYIPGINTIAIGYIDGMIDLYNLEDSSFERVEDIFRVQVFTAKQINDFELFGDELYVSTDFGIVVYDTESFLVSNSYTKIGRFDRGTPVLDIRIDDEMIYIGTQQGVASANLNDNLSIESSWMVYSEEDGLPAGNISSVIVHDGRFLASSEDGVYILNENVWNTYTVLNGYEDVRFETVREENELVAFNQNRIFFIDKNESLTVVEPEINTISDLDITDDRISIATLTSGLGVNNGAGSSFDFIVPEGPNLNFFDGMLFNEGVFLSGTSRLSQRNSFIDNRKGYYIRNENGWQNYNVNTSETLREARFRQAFTTAITDEYYYIGSWGRGIARHNKETDDIEVFNSSNSSLRGWAADDPTFPVITGLETDEEEAVWATSRYATNPLYVQLPGENEWINYPKSAAVSSNDEYLNLFVDSFNQKWITLQTAGGAGRGVLVLDTGDPTVVDESTGVKLTEEAGRGNLPDASVTAIIEDKEGEVWVGTERGIARFIFPQFIITGSQEERRAQWLINEDPDAASPFLLRDINVTSMAVNAANQKWIGTASEGVWLLNATGGRILKRFTSENSPLFSDAIRDIAVNDQTGEVYFSTEAGLSIYRDIPIAAVSSMDDLKVYPNPFLYDRHTDITIENLSDITTIRILGVDGTLIRVIENRGGRVAWDGRNESGDRVGSGVYVIVALGPEGDERGIGKVAIIK